MLLFDALLHKFWELSEPFRLLSDRGSALGNPTMTVRILVGAALGLALSSAALAQSYTAPAGIPAATAPGGLEGRAADRNFHAYTGRLSHPVPGRSGAADADVTGSVRGALPQRGR
ncbi:hypothetical protein ASF22_17855 [Methylobacterium sp. Leaf87]|nr:hypothetical protein ASF22_17855 [Methylobacterium sp. Leaf87]